MHDVQNELAKALLSFLGTNLPLRDARDWSEYVLDKLSFQQRKIAEERKFSSLSDFDLAGLLRLLDQNWHELNQRLRLPSEARNWLKEAQSIRNRWAHLPPGGLSSEDIYRDVDTFLRLMKAVGAESSSLLLVSDFRERARRDMANQETRPTATGADTPKTATAATAISKGDVVRLKARPGQTGAVIEVHAGGDETRFTVFHDGTIATYYESQLAPANSRPKRKDVGPGDLHAALSALQLRHPSTSHLYSLFASRINFVPYQFRPVLKLIQSDRPRLLIADEVGVGKTIEAGLILKELQARRDIRSVLIICPKPLVAERKWLEELKRFDEQFMHLDGKSLEYCVTETHLDGIWPQQYAKAILPYSLLDEDLLLGKQKGKQRQRGLLDLDPPPAFDLVIVDEAHHIRNTDTWAYRTVRYFCDNAEAVVLMSATPIQLGDNDLFNLLHLLRPDILPTRQAFEHMAEPNPHLNLAIEVVRAAKNDWVADARKHIEAAAATSWGKGVLAPDPRLQDVYDLLGDEAITQKDRLAIVQRLEQLFTFSPMINRTRRRDIGNFTTRKPETVAVEFTPEQADLHRDLINVIARMLAHRHGDQNLMFMLTTVRRQVASCVFGLAPLLEGILHRHLSQVELSETDGEDVSAALSDAFLDFRSDVDALINRAKSISEADPKFDAFLKVIRDKQKLPNNKLLVFSTFRHTLAYLVARMAHEPVRVGLIHGDVADEERRVLRYRFSLPKENPLAVDVLLSSEVGCEGLDFQFCDGLVNYDLPWNPMRVEQRIGRIDRYGQKSDTVAIYNLITPGTVDAEIYERCLLRIGVFRQALGGSEEILGRLTREIRDIAENMSLTSEELKARLQQLADNEIRAVQEQQRLEEEQTKLFGLTLPSRDEDMVKRASSFWLSPSRLANLANRYLDSLGVSGLAQPFDRKAVLNLQLNQDARARLLADFKSLNLSGSTALGWERWLKGSDPNFYATFDQATASDRRDLAFITPTHPLARQAARQFEPVGVVNSAIVAASSVVAPGRYPYAIYRWRTLGLKEDFVFHPVTLDPSLSQHFLELLESATAAAYATDISPDEEAALESVHYQAWTNARAKHIEEVANLAGARLASLRTSHAARIAILEEQRDAVGDSRIRRMRGSQLASAQQDYERRKSELEEASQLGEIVAEPVAFGVLTVERAS